MPDDPFGCEHCFKADAESMARAKPKFNFIARLVDESHFIVSILACPACSQRCLSIFTETIDWTGGDDSQLVRVLPITPQESGSLQKSGDDLIPQIESLGRDRPYLLDNHPTGGPRQVRWIKGALWIGPHD